MMKITAVVVCIIATIDAFQMKRAPVNQQRISSLFMVGDAVVTIGTRGSPLALAQAYETKRLLGVHFPELAVEGAVEIKKIMTKVNDHSCWNVATLHISLLCLLTCWYFFREIPF